MSARRSTLYCSFCGKAEREVIALVAGPAVFICDECVEVCVDVVAEKKAKAIEAKVTKAAQDTARLAPPQRPA